MVDHQIMQGIPWEEAYTGTAYPSAVENDLNGRRSLTNPDKVIFLAIDSLNPARDGLANNWGANGEEPRSGAWTMILKDLTTFNRFKDFARDVYTRLKVRYPDLKLLFSISLKSPGSSEMNLVKTNIADILQYVDVIGVSVYPYIFFNHADKGDPANLSIMPTRGIRPTCRQTGCHRSRILLRASRSSLRRPGGLPRISSCPHSASVFPAMSPTRKPTSPNSWKNQIGWASNSSSGGASSIFRHFGKVP